MYRFLLNLVRFLIFSIGIILIIILLPATPKSSNSLLFISKNKETSLKKTQSPRIVFLGGSNLSFGLDSKLIKDSLHLNPVNMGIHASLGFKYMMSQYYNHKKKGDIVVLIPEYQQYFDDFAEGTDGEELARMIFDVDLKNYFNLNRNQRIKIFSSLPKILKSKFKLDEYFGYDFDFIYSRYVYNDYGDVDRKYLIKKRTFKPSNSFNNLSINYDLLFDIIEFQKSLKMKGIHLFISFPGYQVASFNNSKEKIAQVYNILTNYKFELIGTPEMFRMHDTLMLNSPYHLNNDGVNRRTILLINSLKKSL
jgi:hypothetical protein